MLIDRQEAEHLAPMDYFLWGTVKEKCFADKSGTNKHLKANIRNAIADIQPYPLEKMS